MLASNYQKTVQASQEFEELLEFFTSEILKEQPPDLINFGVHFFQTLDRGKEWHSRKHTQRQTNTVNILSIAEPRVNKAPPRLKISMIDPDRRVPPPKHTNLKFNITPQVNMHDQKSQFNLFSEQRDSFSEHEEKMRIIFEKMDKDGSGHIDEFELANFLSVFAGYLNQPIPNQKQVKMLYKLLDADLDGKISYEEIREVLCQIIKIVENKFTNEYEILMYEGILKDKEKLDATLKELFEEFDADGSGQIDKKELYALLLAVSEQFDIDPPSQGDVELVLSNLDENSDNLLDYTEIKHFLEAILEELIEKRKAAIDREASEQEDSAYVQFSYNQILQNEELIEQTCQQLFNEADLNGNQYIEFDELQKFANFIAQEFEQEEPTDTRDLLNMLDLDKDGRLSYAEAKPYLKEIIEMRADQESQSKKEVQGNETQDISEA